MKKYILLILMFFAIGLYNNTYSQPPLPPGNGGVGGGKGLGGNQGKNGSAPIGTADFLLVSLAALYGANKFYQSRKLKEA